MSELRDGTSVPDARLDRLVAFDDRSRRYPIRQVTVGRRPRSYSWRIGQHYVIDQGAEGACVGFAVTNELLARPAEVSLSLGRAQALAMQLYWDAQRNDQWAGGSYPGADPFYEGTSVLAGVKAAQKLGYFQEYRWAFGLEDLVYGLGHHGPAVLGLVWYSSMYAPDAHGFIHHQGSVVGGHAILACAVKIVWKSRRVLWWKRTWTDVDLEASYITLRNSWGPHYGKRGDCYISLADMDGWLKKQGEAVFFRKRSVDPVQPVS